MPEKPDIHKRFTELLSEALRKTERSLEELRERIRDSPGANQSHSDTTKSQLSAVALGTEKQIIELREMRDALKFASTPFAGPTIKPGALIEVEQNGSSDWFLLLPKARGDSVETNGVEITAISVQTPMAQALLHRSVGDTIPWRNGDMKIVNAL